MKFNENLKNAMRFMKKRNKLPDPNLHLDYVNLYLCGQCIGTMLKNGQIIFDTNFTYEAILESTEWDNN